MCNPKQKVCVEPPPPALNMTLPAFDAESRRLQQTHRPPLLLSIDMGQTDRRTDTRPLHRRCIAGSAPGTPCTMESSILGVPRTRRNQYAAAGALACARRTRGDVARCHDIGYASMRRIICKYDVDYKIGSTQHIVTPP